MAPLSIKARVRKPLIQISDSLEQPISLLNKLHFRGLGSELETSSIRPSMATFVSLNVPLMLVDSSSIYRGLQYDHYFGYSDNNWGVSGIHLSETLSVGIHLWYLQLYHCHSADLYVLPFSSLPTFDRDSQFSSLAVAVIRYFDTYLSQQQADSLSLSYVWYHCPLVASPRITLRVPYFVVPHMLHYFRSEPWWHFLILRS